MAKKINIVGAKPKKIEVVDQPKRRIDPADLAAALGANPTGEQAPGNLDAIALAELGTQLLHRLRSSGGRPALADATINCRVPLSAEDVQTLENMVAHIGASTGAKPSVGQLASVIVRMHLNALKSALEPAASANAPRQNIEHEISRSILQQMIDEQINPIREQVKRLETELHAVCYAGVQSSPNRELRAGVQRLEQSRGGIMAINLLRPGWGQLDSHELRILLDNRIGGPGQYYGRETAPDRLHLPLAGATCRVVLNYCDRRIASVEPGQAFDAAEWDRIADEIETSILTGPTKVGRDYSFSSYRVHGSWRGERSGVQILPPHPDAPRAPVEMAEHAFILEFPLQVTGLWDVTNHRRLREHRDLTLLLNTLLRGRTNLQPRRSNHFWGCIRRDGAAPEIRWVQNFYFAGLGECVLDAPSPLTTERLEVIESDRYYTEVAGIDGRGLRVPADLDESISRYQQLHPTRREEFNRAAFWLDMASRQWNISMSASFAALVSTVESLIHTRGPGATGRFRDFFERFASGASLAARRNQMYDLRSGILHGSELMTIDEDIAFGWDPPWLNERELHEELWTLTRIAVRNWLRNPPPL